MSKHQVNDLAWVCRISGISQPNPSGETQILKRAQEQEKSMFPVSLTTGGVANHTPLMPSSLELIVTPPLRTFNVCAWVVLSGGGGGAVPSNMTKLPDVEYYRYAKTRGCAIKW